MSYLELICVHSIPMTKYRYSRRVHQTKRLKRNDDKTTSNTNIQVCISYDFELFTMGAKIKKNIYVTRAETRLFEKLKFIYEYTNLCMCLSIFRCYSCFSLHPLILLCSQKTTFLRSFIHDQSHFNVHSAHSFKVSDVGV